MQPTLPVPRPPLVPRLLARQMAPEILDTLPEASEEARRARRDLRIFNRVMATERWLAATLAEQVRPGDRVLELGAGTGELARALHRRGISVDAIDRCAAPPGWPDDQHWFCTDVRAFDGWSGYTVVIANLFLHHLTSDELAALGAAAGPHARLIVACEPARRWRFLQLFRLVCLLSRACASSWHDGAVSIAAGFSGDELAQCLDLPQSQWRARGAVRGRGTYQFLAERIP